MPLNPVLRGGNKRDERDRGPECDARGYIGQIYLEPQRGRIEHYSPKKYSYFLCFLRIV